MQSPSPRLIGFRVSIALVLVATVFLMAVATVSVVIQIGSDASRKNAEELFTRIGETVGERTDTLFESPISLAQYASLDEEAAEPIVGNGRNHNFIGFMIGSLEATPSLYSIYVGDISGDFLQVIQTNADKRILEAHNAPVGTRFILRAITGQGKQRTQHWTFYGAKRLQLGQRDETAFTYVPADRPWFKSVAGRAEGRAVLSDPYIFSSLKAPGITASVALSGHPQGRVLGVDLTLAGLQNFIDVQAVSEHGAVMLLDRNKNIMAKTANFERRPGWLVKNVTHKIAGQDFEVILTAPPEDFDGDFRTMELTLVLSTLGLLFLVLPMTLIFTKRLTVIMTVLSEDVARVCKLDFSGDAPAGSRIREFDQLARGFSTMKNTLSSETAILATEKLKLEKIVEAGIALSTEKNTEALLQKILDTAMELTEADGGTLYQVNPEGTHLDFKVMVTESTNFRRGGIHGAPPTFKVALYGEKGEENHRNVATHAFHTKKSLNIPDVYNDLQFDFSGTKAFDANNNYKTDSILTVPLKPLGSDVLGALQLINAKAADGVTSIPFAKGMEDFVKSLAASAATALYNKKLIDDLEHLFDAIIDVINGAIGRKSPYTGGHCDRVPVIAIELAKATSSVQTGPLAGFVLSQNQEKEFALAAKLHDVGKVTTPEYVVDKSTKLETIYNRIHEIRTRFEVLYRDAIIARHETVLADKKAATEADRKLAETKAQLMAEWQVVAKTNLGGEYLSPANAEEIRTIANRTWVRNFDDRIGLSWQEALRVADLPPTELPVVEKLLDDKPIHRFARHTAFEKEYSVKDKDGNIKSTYQFKTPVPELLYNQGEVYNLTIGRGTLTNEEHFKIKEHVMQTIYMLDQLPWPKGQEKVPTIAGEHHESLVGNGYPYEKKGEVLSIQSRILAIADIFEALTAWDRPYKTPKKLSEAVKVLYMFKKDRHIDAELFDLFLTSGVYKTYADEYIAKRGGHPELVDDVDITPYLGEVPAGPQPSAH